MIIPTTELRRFLERPGEILVSTHIHPDGDAIGCLLAFGGLLDQLGLSYQLAVDDHLPKRYRFMPGFNSIRDLKARPLDRKFDRFVVLDAGSIERTGAARLALKDGARVLNIDHHFSGALYGEINIVDVQASATAEVLFFICRELGVEITPQIGTGLFVGILTDTGRFRFDNTNPAALQICGELVALGIDPGKINSHVYFDVFPEQLLALGKALTGLEMRLGGDVCLITLDHADMVDDTEGFVEQAASVRGVKLAAFLSEIEPGIFKASLRSRSDIDVSAIATVFGGGGHKKAAGFKLEGTRADITRRLLAEMKRHLQTTPAPAAATVKRNGRKPAAQKKLAHAESID